MKLEGVSGVRYMYHDPCHSPMKQQDPLKTVNALVATADGWRSRRTIAAAASPARFAISRPDIATQVRFRKEREVEPGRGGSAPTASTVTVKVLTSCPSCLQGLKRYNDDAGIDADYIVVEIARHVLGADWMPEYVSQRQRRRHRARAGLARSWRSRLRSRRMNRQIAVRPAHATADDDEIARIIGAVHPDSAAHGRRDRGSGTSSR